MRNKIYSFLRGYVIPGDQVIVAVSGGKDSMALLHALHSLEKELQISVSAAHFQHGLRGAESQRDEDFVRTYCASEKIPLAVGHGNVRTYAKEQRLGTEEAARILRYEFLENLQQHAKIVTAHTAQDNLETMLMHLIRGSGLHGLTGIPPERGRILRPMLEVTQQEITDYLTQHHIPHVEDSSNASDHYLRNRIRHHIVPMLEQENPSVSQSVAQLCKTLRQEDDYMQSQALEAIRLLSRDGLLSCDGLLQLPEAIQHRVMSLYLSPVPQVGRTHLEAALALCKSPSPSAELCLPNAWRLNRLYGQLQLEPERKQVPPAPVLLSLDHPARFGPWVVTCRRTIMPDTLDPGTLALRADAVTGPLTLRPRRTGDTITLHGGTKKLSRLMIDEKIPAAWRDTLPVVCAGSTILAVLPLKTAAFCRGEVGCDSFLLSATRMED